MKKESHKSAKINENAVDDIDRLLPFKAHDLLFMRRVIEQYPGVYEDEMQGRLQYARGKTVWLPSIDA